MIRWLSNSRVSLQRLGFCKVAVAVCDGPRSREELSEAARQLTQQPIAVPADGDLARWVQARPKTSPQTLSGGHVQVALQDQWVFQHKSRTGWLLDLAHEEYFEKIGLPMMLGLVDDECRRTDWGDLLLAMAPRATLEPTPSDTTPLTLTTAEIMLFLYVILRQDGDFLIPYLHDLTRFGDAPFSHIDAGQNVPGVMEEVLARFRSAVYTGEDRERFDDLRLAQTKIRENIARRVETMGSGSRREQTVLPRLEWLVDVGILSKQEGEARVYVMSKRGKAFCERAYSEYIQLANDGFPEEAVVRLLDRRFFHLTRPMLFNEGELQAPADVISFVAPAYHRLKSSTGYCVGKTLLLLAHSAQWNDGSAATIEYDVARRALEDAYQQDPNRFYFTTARFGEDFQIRLEN